MHIHKPLVEYEWMVFVGVMTASRPSEENAVALAADQSGSLHLSMPRNVRLQQSTICSNNSNNQKICFIKKLCRQSNVNNELETFIFSLLYEFVAELN